MLMAQNQKDIEIKIENGDTTINGKDIKTLSPKDRENALKDIKHISTDMTPDGNKHFYLFNRKDTLVNGHVTGDGSNPMITENIVITKDSLGNTVETRLRGRSAMRNRMPFKYKNPDDMPDRMDWRNGGPMRAPMMRPEHRNSQNFTYVNTDNNDISTRISFHISDVTNDDLKRMPHIEGPRLDITDLNIVPQFSTGKILLMFSLPSRGPAEVKLVDGEGKDLWSEKSAGTNFIKSFVLGLNGIYYLQVKQGNGIAIKRIMKEE